MRTHLYAAAGLSALLLALSGCSGDAGAEPEAAAGAPAAATPATTAATGGSADPAAAATTAAKGKAGDKALAADTEAICEQASRTSTSFGQTFAEDYKLLIEATRTGGQAKADAEQKAKRDVENFSFALVDMSKLASDKGLKKALAAMGDEVTELKGDLEKLDDEKLAGLHATLDKACGRE
ncbi:hypothetical protein ACTI_32280 [Actinoplanes sp. OR16]|uniref:hypothetical protein n=1 Tax=Actinoplanes sp. OR16 TaxID=946334 RepID=UPI000F6C4FA3|nr:hypothetical protein [Actinoplanes sp. OR16]BBH66543.1 hypothetical protein ACTI_32280 [Actinoplanes sp. OR16]